MLFLSNAFGTLTSSSHKEVDNHRGDNHTLKKLLKVVKKVFSHLSKTFFPLFNRTARPTWSFLPGQKARKKIKNPTEGG